MLLCKKCIELNADKDECGICNGPGSVYECGCSVCAQCGDESAINNNEEAINDYMICFEKLFPYVDYFVVNVSSPNTPELRDLQEKEPLNKLLVSLQKSNNNKDK